MVDIPKLHLLYKAGLELRLCAMLGWLHAMRRGCYRSTPAKISHILKTRCVLHRWCVGPEGWPCYWAKCPSFSISNEKTRSRIFNERKCKHKRRFDNNFQTKKLHLVDRSTYDTIENFNNKGNYSFQWELLQHFEIKEKRICWLKTERKSKVFHFSN